MAHISKRRKAFTAKVDPKKTYAAAEALNLVKETATAKFDEAIDVAVNLGIDAKKGDQTVRGSVVLPAGTGKKVRVAVFAPGDKAQAAKAAGADVVGMEDLAEQVKAGKLDFDVVIAAPEAMRVVGQLGQILGPRGLMPNPKVGTVTPDVAGAVKNAKAGQVQFRADKSGVVQCTNFSEEAIRVEHDGGRCESRSRIALDRAMTLGCCFNEQLSSKTAGAGNGLIAQCPAQTAYPEEGMQYGFLIQGRRFCNMAKEVDLGS